MSVISAPLRHFFFTAFKARKEFKTAEKAIGKIKSVSVIITPERTFMRACSEDKKFDTDFTDQEKKQMLTTFKVKEETINACKSIFLMLDLEGKKIHIRQNLLDGSKKELEL